jgi:hypothetical protein
VHARYYFNLKRRDGTLVDPDGLDLPDQTAAREYALQVMSELMRNATVRTRAWRSWTRVNSPVSSFSSQATTIPWRICRRNFARQLKWLAADTPRSWMQ